jgi:hypothetical protein
LATGGRGNLRILLHFGDLLEGLLSKYGDFKTVFLGIQQLWCTRFFSVAKWQRFGKIKTLATNTSNDIVIIKFYVPIWSTT